MAKLAKNKAEDGLSRFNASQREAILCTKGPLLILAGPGTGKTSVLIAKIAELARTGIKPDRILAVTFSKKATLEIEERLSESSAHLAQSVTVSTLHSFCTDLVQRHGFRLGIQQKVRMMTEAESHLFFRQMASRLPLDTFFKTSNLDPIISDLLEFFQKAKDEGFWPEDIIRYSLTLPEETEDQIQIKREWTALGDIYNSYQGFCFEKGFIDFGDAVLCALRILQDFPIVREEVQNTYDAILVDEFQDTNWSQIRLLKLLRREDAHIAVVGDDDQSIYRFRGASYSAFRFFGEAFEDFKTIELDQTYRLSPEILKAASELIKANGANRFLADKKLQSAKKSGEKVRVLKTASFEDEAFAIADEIEKLLKIGVEPSSIGVLVRAHSHAEFLLSEGARRKIPFEALSSTMLFEEAIVRDVLAFFKVLLKPEDSVSFLRLLDSVFLRLEADDIYKICRHPSSKKSFIDLLDEVDSLPISDNAKVSLKKFFQLYKQLVAQSFRKPGSEVLLSLYEKSEAIAHLLKTDEATLKILTRFHSQLAAWEKVQPERELRLIFPLLESFARHELTIDEEAAGEIAKDKIPILTVHASKGLEFEHVFILSLVGRRFPQNFRQPLWKFPKELEREASGTKELHTEEERRLFYVAMTRAKSNLTLSTIEKKGTKPSLFIADDLKALLPQFELIEIPERNRPLTTVLDRQPFERVAAASKSKPLTNGKGLRLSFTQLDKYETCPLQYRFAYDLKIPIPPSPSLLVGSAVHSALEQFYKEVKDGAVPSKEDLISYFDKEFAEKKKENSELSELDQKLGHDKLAQYFDFQANQFKAPHAIEQPFQLQIGDHTVSGKIDRIDKVENEFVIIDYKTGKSKSSEDAGDKKFAKDSLQLSIYALAAKEALNLQLKELVFYYVYDNKTLSSTRSEEDLTKTRERILNLATQIQARNFQARPGFYCQWCEYKALCPTAK